MRANKLDSNHREIVEGLEARGHLVRSTAGLKDGFPDLLVGARRPTVRYVGGKPLPDFDRVLMALEIKKPRNKRGDLEPLTEAEAKFHHQWKGFAVYVVGDLSQALRVVEGLP
jgi:hypothetical protein